MVVSKHFVLCQAFQQRNVNSLKLFVGMSLVVLIVLKFSESSIRERFGTTFAMLQIAMPIYYMQARVARSA